MCIFLKCFNNALSFPMLRVYKFIYFFFCKPATISHHEHSDSPIKYSTLNVRRISSVSTVTIAHHERVQLPNCPRTEATYCKWAWERTARTRSMALRWTAIGYRLNSKSRLHFLSEGQIEGRLVVVNPDFIDFVADVSRCWSCSAEYKIIRLE